MNTLRETIKNSVDEAKKNSEASASDSSKKSKKEVDYSLGMKKSHCGICEYFISPNKCQKVKGEISKEYWCELFEAAR